MPLYLGVSGCFISQTTEQLHVLQKQQLIRNGRQGEKEVPLPLPPLFPWVPASDWLYTKRCHYNSQWSLEPNNHNLLQGPSTDHHYLGYSINMAEYGEWAVLEEREDITLVWVPTAYLSVPWTLVIMVSELFLGLSKISLLKTPEGGVTEMS